MVSHLAKHQDETKPWPRQSMANRMPRRHMRGCQGMHVTSSPTLA